VSREVVNGSSNPCNAQVPAITCVVSVIYRWRSVPVQHGGACCASAAGRRPAGRDGPACRWPGGTVADAVVPEQVASSLWLITVPDARWERP